jgi:hypothetical protein
MTSPRSPVTRMPSTGSARASMRRQRPRRRSALEGAGIDGVAAQLVARERRAIDKADANARRGPGHPGTNRRARADNQTSSIGNWVIG